MESSESQGSSESAANLPDSATPDRGPDRGPDHDPDRDHDHDHDHDHEPDYRFTLANERTFLAYLRTALSVNAAGIAVMEFVSHLGPEWARRGFAIVLAVTGMALSIGGYLRWRANLRAMRAEAPLPRTTMPLGLAAAVLLVSIVALYLVATGDR